jgi:uncharacterized protein YecT (DUF1311 family)
MKLFLLSLAILGSPAAHAASVPPTAAADPRCSGTDSEMIECAAAALQKADDKLNASYQAALRRIEATTATGEPRRNTRKGLIEAQRLWIQFREKDCGTRRDYEENSQLGSAFYLGCMAERAEQRANELDSSFDE